MVLPVICAATFVGMELLFGDDSLAPHSRMTKLNDDDEDAIQAQITQECRVVLYLGFLVVPWTCWLPTAFFCYWIPNNLYNIAFSLALQNRWIKSRVAPDIDLAAIPGTKAHAQAQGSLKQPLKLEKPDGATAAASYIKRVDAGRGGKN